MNTRLAQTNPIDDAALDEAIADAVDTSSVVWMDLLWAALILLGALIVARIVRLLIGRLSDRTRADTFLTALAGRILGYLIVAVGLVYSLGSLGIRVTPILGALGIVGIALAFALQDILENFVAGIILQLQRPFRTGDEVVSAGHEGTIVGVDARTVTMHTPDGETVRLPSAAVIKNPIVNHSRVGRRRTTLEVGVAYGTDLDRAVEVARHAVAEVPLVLSRPAVEVLVHAFGESSIDLSIRFWHAPSIAARWRTRDEAARAVTRAFRGNGIEIPFPQRVIHQPTGALPTSEASHAD